MINNKIRKNRILASIMTMIAITILSIQVVALTIQITDGNGNVIATGYNTLPSGYYCMNHGWVAAERYVPNGYHQFDNSTIDLIESFIFSSYYNRAGHSAADEKVMQNALWYARAAEGAGYCEYPAIDSNSRNLYLKAKHYASVVEQNAMLDLYDTEDTTRSMEMVDGNAKYFYKFGIGFNNSLDEVDMSYDDEIITHVGQFEFTEPKTVEYYDYNGNSYTSNDAYNISVKLNFELSQEQYDNITSIHLYYEDENGMLQDSGVDSNMIKNNLGLTNNTTISDGNGLIAKDAANNYVHLYKNGRGNYVKDYGINAAKLIITYKTSNPTNVKFATIGYGDDELNENEYLSYITSIEISGIDKNDAPLPTIKYTDGASIKQIVENNFKVGFDDAKWYDAKNVSMKVEYKNLKCSGGYYEFVSANAANRNSKQTLIRPEAKREFESKSITVQIGPGDRYVNIGVNKYEGTTAKNKSNALPGAKFTMETGYFDIANLASVDYETAKQKFTSVKNNGRIGDVATSTFNWEDIPLEFSDIERGYIVFKFTEEPPERHEGVQPFYVIAGIKDMQIKEKFYYLKDLKLIYSEADNEKILFNENDADTVSGFRKIISINVANSKSGDGQLQLLKIDEKETGINGIKFDITTEQLLNGVIISEKTENNTIITKRDDYTIDQIGTHDDTDGVGKLTTKFANITSIKYTVTENDDGLPSYLKPVPRFTMEFGVKKLGDTYALSSIYTDERQNIYEDSFKFNGEIVRFDDVTIGGIQCFSNGNVSIGIKNAGTTNAEIMLIIVDETVAFDLNIHKTDLSIPSINVEGVGFDVRVTRVSKTDYNNEIAEIYKGTKLLTDKNGNITANGIKNISLKNMNPNTEYIKVTITETVPPEVEQGAYYDVINKGADGKGKPFSFIAETETIGSKIKLSKIVDKIDWPTDEHGNADEPEIESNKLRVNLNIRDKFIKDGKYTIQLEKRDALTNDLITSSPAKFKIKVGERELGEFTTVNGKIDLGYDIELENTNPQEISFKETQAPEGYELINGGDWFTAKVGVIELADGYRIDDRTDKMSGWPKDAELSVSGGYIVKVVVKDQKDIDGKYTISILKKDADTNDLITSGEAEFEIKLGNNSLGKFSTVNGKIELGYDIPLTSTAEQKLSFRETKAPEGYTLINNGDWFTASINVEEYNSSYRIGNTISKYDGWPSGAKIDTVNNYVVKVEVWDKKESNDYFTLKLTKINENNEVLEGAKFTIKIDNKIVKDAEGNDYHITGADGVISIISGLKNEDTEKKISIQEIEAPTYVEDGITKSYEKIANGEEFSATIGVKKVSNKPVLDHSIVTKSANWPVEATDDTDSNNNLVIAYKLKDNKAVSGSYDIKLAKVDENNHDIYLEDAEFEISVNGKKLVDPKDGDTTFTTNSSGIITTGKIELKDTADQNITFTEIKAPVGYKSINSGNPISVTLPVKQVGRKFVIDDPADNQHQFFPLGYEERVSDGAQYEVKLPDPPTTFELKLNKKFKDSTETRKAEFKITDMVNGETNVIDTAESTTAKFKITSDNAAGIKLKVEETDKYKSDNSDWGILPPFYAIFNTKRAGSTYVIEGTAKLEAVNAGDKDEFEKVKSLINVKVSADGLSIEIEATNPKKGQMDIGLLKFDSDSKEKLQGVKFNITVKPYGDTTAGKSFELATDSQGTFEIPNVPITSASGTIEVKVHELTYSEGNTVIKYYREIPDFTIILNKSLVNQTYTVDDFTTDLPDGTGIEISLDGEAAKKSLKINVPNKKRIMRLSGKVWEDVVSSGKISELSGDKDGSEKFINGVTVKLHASDETILEKYKDIIGNAEKKTSGQDASGNDTGEYYFDVPMFDGTYYVEFIYNGYKYQHTKYTPWNGEGIYSNATETETDRDNLNKNFETISSGSISNKINNTTVNDSRYGGTTISISAFTGGFGRNNLVTYSASKYDGTEGKCDNKSNAGNTTKYIDASSSEMTIDGKHYDYIYENINLGITARETVNMGLAKSVNKVELDSANNIIQTYNGTDNLESIKPTDNIVNMSGSTFKNIDDSNKEKYNNSKEFVGKYDVGLSIEDAYTTTTNAVDSGIKKVSTFITYRIALYNYSSEIGIQFNDIVDYFDNTLTYSSAKLEGGSGEITAEVKEETKEIPVINDSNAQEGSRTFKELHLKLNNIRLNPGATQYVDVTFEMDTIPENILKTDGGSKILDSEDILGKTKVNVAEVYSYTTYYADLAVNSGRDYTYVEHKTYDIANPENTFEIAGILDQESNPGNVNKLQLTGVALKPYLPIENEPDDGIAILRFIEREVRKLGGTVWIEDRNKEVNGAMIGDGILNESGRYKGVTVQLYEYYTAEDGSKSERVAKVFDYSSKKWVDVTQRTTGEDGTYTPFEGIAPGDYYILFTYPDGQTYKSTIFNNGENLPTEFANNPDSNDGVKFDTGNDANYSFARDIQGDIDKPKTRKFVNNLLAENGEINSNVKENYNKYIEENASNLAMQAKTGHINVGFERTDNPDQNISAPSQYTSVDKLNVITWVFNREYKVNNLNLGVVERPKSQLQIFKKVSHVKMTLSDGSTLFDTSGKATNVRWYESKKATPTYTNNIIDTIDNTLIDADSNMVPTWRQSAVKGVINLTMDEELMTGAILKVKYNIQVTNAGEIDYKDNEFYYLGKENNAASNIVKTEVNKIVDYVGYQSDSSTNATRNNLKYVETDNTGLGWTEVSLNNLISDGLLSEQAAYGENYGKNINGAVVTDKRGASLYNTILVNNLNKALEPKLVDGTQSDNNTTSKDLTLSTIISQNSTSDDMTYNNLVEIIKLTNESGRRTAYSTVGNQDPTSEAGPQELDSDEAEETAILPPFGQNPIYYIIGTIVALTLVIVGTVVTISKKKTSNK